VRQKLDRCGAGVHRRAMSQNALILEGIAKRICIAAIYNRAAIKLAPHILYTRHDQLYVDGVIYERDGQPPKERKIGTFKLDGLKETKVIDLPFTPERSFDPSAEKYVQTTLLAVQA